MKAARPNSFVTLKFLAMLLAGSLVLWGCDQNAPENETQPAEFENPYAKMAEDQKKTLEFVDAYVEKHAEKKRAGQDSALSAAERKNLTKEAYLRWAENQGYDPAQMSNVWGEVWGEVEKQRTPISQQQTAGGEQQQAQGLTPREVFERAMEESDASEAVKAFLRRLGKAAQESGSVEELREKLHEIEKQADSELVEEEAAVVFGMSASIKGAAAYWTEQGREIKASAERSVLQGSASCADSTGASLASSEECQAPPRKGEYGSLAGAAWWGITGGLTGCGVGVTAGSWFPVVGQGTGCIAGGGLGFSTGFSAYYVDRELRFETAAVRWCIKCDGRTQRAVVFCDRVESEDFP